MDFLCHLISRYGIWAMLLLIFLEYACFPVSSEIVLPLCGAFSAAKSYPFLLIIPLSVTSGLLGTSLCFLIGRTGGEAILKKLMERFPKTRKGITRSIHAFEKHGALMVGVLRVVPLCRTYIAFVAGAFLMSPSTFFWASLLGITLWNTVLIGAGYLLGANWQQVQTWYVQYQYVLIPVILLVLSVIVCIVILKKKV